MEENFYRSPAKVDAVPPVDLTDPTSIEAHLAKGTCRHSGKATSNLCPGCARDVAGVGHAEECPENPANAPTDDAAE
jgi:hypothetical protein